jgi:hypothetical protein
MHDLIPHQLHLTRPQMTKMMKGQGINIPHSQMGSDKGDAVIMLHPQNARKLLTAYKKGKGMRLTMSPAEMHHSMTHGRGINIGKAFKKLGRDIKSGAEKAIKVVDKEVIRPAGKALGSKEAIDVYKQIGKHAIEQGLPALTTLGSMALGDPTGMSGAMVGNIGSQYASKAYSDKVGAGLYGGAMTNPADARKQYMAIIRSMRGMSEAEKAKIKGSGFFKTLKKWTGIGKTQFLGEAKKMGKQAIKTGAMAVGEAVGAYTGNPVAGVMLGQALGKAGDKAVDSIQPSKGKLGIKFDPKAGLRSLKDDAKMYAVEAMDRQIDKLPPEMRNVAQDALAGKYPDAQSLIYDVSQKELARRQQMDMYGSGMMKRGRGRPRKNVMGAGAPQSRAYQMAMKNNYDGLQLTNITDDNSPISDYSVNPNVMPSSSEMTLSPYQSPSAPAMNPFIPTRYTQMGGTQSGYGGRGLYGGGLF